MAAFLLSRTFWYGLAIVCVAGYLIHLGNRYGPNASLVAAYEAEIKSKNTEIASLNAADAVIAAHEMTEQLRNETAFDTAAPTLPKCLVTQPLADALNPFIKEGG